MENIPTYSDKVEEIMLALGKRAEFSEKSKREFIDAIYMHLLMAVPHGETFLPNAGKEFLDEVHTLETAIITVQHKIDHSWEGANAGTAAFKDVGLDRKEFFKQSFLILDALKREITSRTARKHPGQDNIRAHSIAKMIAIEYHRHFKRYPRTGNGEFIESQGAKGRKLKLTPYDRVCDIIQKTYCPKGLITFSTRKAAIEEVKNGGGMRPRRTI